jgi:CRP-like cAMP-binding protein
MNADPCFTCVNQHCELCIEAKIAALRYGCTITPGLLKTVRRGQTILVRNKPSKDVFVLCEGWAAHFLTLADGRRQILSFLLPGDFLSPAGAIKGQPDCSTLAVTNVQLRAFPAADVRDTAQRDPRFGAIISQSLTKNLNEACEMLTVVAQGSAEERIAYLMLHLAAKIRSRGIVLDETYPVPLLQQHIADAVGLTTVYVSRILSDFRARGWMRLGAETLKISNRYELERIGSL